MEMIKMEPCKGCGSITLMGELHPGVTLKCDPAGINAQTLSGRLMLGETDQLWTIRYDTGRMAGFSPASFNTVAAMRSSAPPTVVQVHHCPKALSGDLTASQGSEAPRVPPTAPKPPVAPCTPSVDPSTPTFSVAGDARRAESRPSDPYAQGGGPRCAECSKPMADGTYFAIELGELMQYAAHVDQCTGVGT